VKVACIGNSITQGVNTVPFPEQLDIILGDGWDVQNFGVSGRTLMRSGDYPYWNEAAFTNAMSFLPDKVIIMLGTNDTKPYNWDDHSDEFYGDYISLVDTFAQLESGPDIYVCYPLPSFSNLFDIRDSVIVNGVIPLVDSVIAHRDVNLIDFYSAFEGLRYLTYDGIHPTTTGNNYIAKLLFEVFTGASMVEVIDENALLNKPVTASSGGEDTRELVNDGNMGTEWITEGLPASVTIDMEEAEEIDLLTVNFFNEANRGYQYTIEGSSDGSDWTMLADQSDRTDTLSYFSADEIGPASVRYIRLNITSFANSDVDQVIIPEIRAFVSTGYEHAPIVSAKRNSPSNFYAFYMPLISTGGISLLSGEVPDAHIPIQGISRNNGAIRQISVSGSMGDLKVFVSKLYYDGIEVSSDSIYYTIEQIVSGINENTQNNNLIIYPNPVEGGAVTFLLPENLTEASVIIYDNSGKQIKTLKVINSERLEWDRTDMNSGKVASGIYHCVLSTGNIIIGGGSVVLR